MSQATKITIGVILVVLVLWVSTLFLIGPSEHRGTFGDMFGATNALFSGLAFAGLIYAILLQREELSLQRQELAETRQELRGQKEALEAQLETQLRPLVQVYIEVHREILMTLCVRNAGVGIAKNLKLTIVENTDLLTKKGKLSDFPTFDRAIPSLGPGEALRHIIMSGLEIASHDSPKISVMATYCSHSGTQYDEKFEIDFTHYLNTAILPSERDSLEEIEKHLKKIANKKS